MEVKVLGAGGGEDASSRLSSFLINGKLLLDAGAVTRSLSLKEQEEIKAVLITHAHLDHIRDLPFLLDNFVFKKKHSVKVFAIKEVIKVLKKHIFNNVIWPDFTQIPDPSSPLLEFCVIEPEKPFFWEEYEICAFKANHGVPAVGFLVIKQEKKLFYSGDTGAGTVFWKKLPKVDVIITEVSFPDRLKKLAQISHHYTPEILAEDLSSTKNLAPRLYLFHLKPAFKKEIKNKVRLLLQNSFQEVKVLSDGEVFSI